MTAAFVARFPYGCGVVRMAEDWPDAGRELLRELGGARGRLGLIIGAAPKVNHLVGQLCDDLAVSAVHLGSELSGLAQPPTPNDIEMACGDATVILDIDVLLSPLIEVPVLPFLRNRSRRFPTIAVWPGEIVGGRALYSAPGRPDHYDAAVNDMVVLRPIETRFPDEVPYATERILP